MNTIFAKKIGMTSIFDDKGHKLGVTVLESFPAKVLQIKTTDNDGYNALVLGFGPRKEKHTRKPQMGLFKKAGLASPVRYIRESTATDCSQYKVGQEVGLDVFKDVKLVDIIGVSKGRGFAGTIKRHHFRRGRETHGNKSHRDPGSVGNHTYPAKVFKGKKMAGHMGDGRVTVKNLEIVSMDKDQNLLVVKGSVPGGGNAILGVRKVNKGK